LHLLRAFDALVAEGKTRAAAAKQLRVGAATIWRWQKLGVIPGFSNCGRKSDFAAFNVPEHLLGTVRRLQLTGMTNAAAWKAAADLPHCPPAIAGYLKSRDTVPPSFLRATRLARRTATVIESGEFTHILK
jgi:hypothetical protein